jgi:hypothetical protein
VHAGALDVTCVLPDFAARRKMFPVGLEVQASVVVIVEDLRAGAELAAFTTAVEGDLLGGVVVCGRVTHVEPLGPAVKAVVERDGQKLWLCGAARTELSVGRDVTASGRALVRIGAPVLKRGGVLPGAPM